MPGSPYNGHAFCERFPRVPADQAAPPPAEGWTYLGQTGKADVSRHNFDTIFTSVITIFQILTGVLCSQHFLLLCASCTAAPALFMARLST